MAVKEARVPFIGEFGGCALVESNGWLTCPEKNAKISIHVLKEFMKTVSTKPKGWKLAVGIQITGAGKVFYMWRDEFNTYIECLSEPTTEFNKKYQKLIKHLNGK